MGCLQLLLVVCCCSSIIAVARCIKVDGYSCVSAYWDTVTCVLNITGKPNTTYSLEFIELSYENTTTSCPLVMINHSYSCVCKLQPFTDMDDYEIHLCHESIRLLNVTNSFVPCENIQPSPPHEIEVQQTPETFNITWKSGYENHRYLKKSGILDYQLSLQSKENRTLDSSRHQFHSFQRSQHKPDPKYCIRVRSIIAKSRSYAGTWSEWSSLTCWGKDAAEEQDNILVILMKSLGPVCVAAGVLLFVFYSPTARMKIKTLSHTPSPAPFFQPLYHQHQGNFQEWLSPQGKFVLTYKTEEILKNDSVIVMPKPVATDPEENVDLLNPSAIQLPFTQCQTSYVGLPGFHEASTPVTMVCAGDMSYTQLPFPVWGVSTTEVEVVTPPSKDFLNISRTDSGCSCENLTISPECSEPNSPVDDSPCPPCYCTDYCILNKTAEGFAPVLVSKLAT